MGKSGDQVLKKVSSLRYGVNHAGLGNGYHDTKMCLYTWSGPDPGFAKRGGRVSKLRENWLIWSRNRLNLHGLVVKRGAGAESAPIPGSAPALGCSQNVCMLIHNSIYRGGGGGRYLNTSVVHMHNILL